MSDNKSIWFAIFESKYSLQPFLGYIPSIISFELIKIDENKLTYKFPMRWRAGNKIETVSIKPILEIKKIITKIYDDKLFEEKNYQEKIISLINQLDDKSPLVSDLFEVNKVVGETFIGNFLKRFSIPFNSCKDCVNFCKKIIEINKEIIYSQFKGVIDNEQQ